MRPGGVGVGARLTVGKLDVSLASEDYYIMDLPLVAGSFGPATERQYVIMVSGIRMGLFGV
jgi:hypothetical protein